MEQAREPMDPEEEIVIRIDGVRLGLSPFVRQMVSDVIMAMLRNLKGVEDPERIEISLRLRQS